MERRNCLKNFGNAEFTESSLNIICELVSCLAVSVKGV